MTTRPLIALTGLLASLPILADANTGGTALTNPQISLIVDGAAYTDDLQGAGSEFTGEAAGINHSHGGGHEHGGLEEGFNLREAEVVLSATVDDRYDGYANLAFSVDGVEVEEAYFTTRALPAGWQVKAGKFFSAFGYTNNKHPHSWDFIDQNLAYQSLLGDHGLNDIGAQLTWSPATDTWMQFGLEAMQGHEQEKFGGAEIDAEAVAEALAAADAAGSLNPDPFALPTDVPTADMLPDAGRRGPQIYTGFFKLAPDLGSAYGLQLGLNYALHNSQQETHEELDAAGATEAVLYADGEATLLGLEAVLKRAATGHYGKGAARLQAEYLRLDKDLDILYHSDAAEIGGAITGSQDAFYLQAVYGFAPRWEAGVRYDVTGMSSEIEEGGATTSLPDSSRLSAALTFRPSEYSAWRLQVANADITDGSGVNEQFTQVMLQFNMSMGAHGAHAF